MISSISELATSAPNTLKFGDYSTPFYTGAQQYAQGMLSSLSGNQYDKSMALTSGTKDMNTQIATLLNQIEVKLLR